MFGILSAVALGGAMGYAKKTAAQLNEKEKTERDKARELARLQLSYQKEIGTLKAVAKMAKSARDPEVVAELKSSAARHCIRARELFGQIEELSIPTVYPV